MLHPTVRIIINNADNIKTAAKIYVIGFEIRIRSKNNTMLFPTVYSRNRRSSRAHFSRLHLNKDNNIILADDGKDAAHNFSPFVDANPACLPEERYKAVAGGGNYGKIGLYGFVSADGIHWKKFGSGPIITKGHFDSQNIVFWDKTIGRYVTYYRTYCGNIRSIQRAVSEDFRTWSDPQWVTYDEKAPNDQLYTNAIHPYDRIPGLYVGFPKRFTAGRCVPWDKSGGGGLPGVSDGVFMSSRDGIRFTRWGEAFLRPGLQRERWVNRNNMVAWGFIETPSATPGCPNEISLYSTEDYYTDKPDRLRRMTIRLDGFVSVNAPYSGGAATTKPLTFAAANGGKPTRLLLNASTSGAGFVKCELRDAAGSPIPGFALADAVEKYGDDIDLAMEWKGGSDVSALAGREVSLHFEMKDADVYAYRFGEL